MKKILSLLCLTPAMLIAQEAAPAAPMASLDPGYHRHDGFYLSMNLGGALGGTILSSGGSDFIVRGPGRLVDLKIGRAIQENLILSADLIGRTITGPEVETEGVSGTSSNDVIAQDGALGFGLTKYFMPDNVFVSGTLGTGKFTLRNKADHTKGESQWGLSLNLKVGKEWWVSKNWGLGISGGYGTILTKDKEPEGGGDAADIASHQFYLLFNTTFN